MTRYLLRTEFGYYRRTDGKPGWVTFEEDAQVFDSEQKVRDLIEFLGRNVWNPVIIEIEGDMGGSAKEVG